MSVVWPGSRSIVVSVASGGGVVSEGASEVVVVDSSVVDDESASLVADVSSPIKPVVSVPAVASVVVASVDSEGVVVPSVLSSLDEQAARRVTVSMARTVSPAQARAIENVLRIDPIGGRLVALRPFVRLQSPHRPRHCRPIGGRVGVHGIGDQSGGALCGRSGFLWA